MNNVACGTQMGVPRLVHAFGFCFGLLLRRRLCMPFVPIYRLDYRFFPFSIMYAPTPTKAREDNRFNTNVRMAAGMNGFVQ